MSKPDSSEQLHSYFYVYWPEDSSSAMAATAPATATNPLLDMYASALSTGATAVAGSSSLACTDPLLQPSSSTAPVYAGLVTHPAVIPGASNLPMASGATATGNSPEGTEHCGSEASDASSPDAVAWLSTTAADIAEAELTVTSTDLGEYNGSITMTPASVSAPAPHGLITPTTTSVYNSISSPGLPDAATVLCGGSPLSGPGNVCSIVGAQKHQHPSFESSLLKNISKPVAIFFCY